ncbi:AraC family transcriptional regulator [Noviherbaspirillum cavernae]|uniref:AraC family transcriptional regulator n=1 Tax=Noviherbaspirillum cavernae TaxID=2320862 RepID=A0A418X5T5_9BURK|nr:AraC family transcriptional regulator [Noviherbaspirillum cavernae]RJG07800.1 AraC family transcriptional regulator [Noviherbaspirillum cavernae]
MDPLDDVFAAMRVQSAVYARLEATAPWGLSLAGGQSARFGLVVRGGCLLSVEGVVQPIALTAGDCYVLARGTPYVLRDKAGTPTVSCTSVVRDRIGGVVDLGGGGTPATVICGWFTFDELSAQPLVELLPTVLHVRMDQARVHALQATLQLLAMETEQPGLGSSLVISRLADIVFVQAIRAHVAASGDAAPGWLAALSDRKIGPALRAMHRDIAKSWTVESLASIATLSRSAFAMRFKERVGESPLEYLTRWRMFKASCMLRQSNRSLGEIADVIGYESESAFNKAFKRAMGLAPGAYRRGDAGPAQRTAANLAR